MTRATTTKLQPGESTIDRATARQRPDGSYWLDWTILLPNGQKKRRRSKGATKGEVKRRAKATAEEMKKTGANSAWKTLDQLADYIDAVTKPVMTKAQLSDLTRKRYDFALQLLIGNCDKHTHRHSIKNHTIASGIRFKALEDLLTEIAELHMRETARQCRTVLTKYVITRLLRDELITGNPIAGVSLDELTGTKPGQRTRGGKALSRTQYDTVLNWLLERDPEKELPPPKQGRWATATVTKRRNSIDQLLLQMATGLRSTEANRIDWSRVHIDDEDVMSIDVNEWVAKGGIPRTVIVLEPSVVRRMLERRAQAKSKSYVIGAPADQKKVWGYGNRNRATAELYREIARELEIGIMESERSHMWRTTLRSFHEGKVPAAVLNSQFGHSEKTAQKHYTDASDLSSLAQSAQLRKTT